MDLRRNEWAIGSHADDAASQSTSYLRSHSVNEMADDARDKVDEMASDARDKVGEMADDVRDKADEVASNVREKADEVGTQASAKINGVVNGTGQQVSNLGQAIRKRTTKNRADKATNAAADALERSGRYLQDQDVNGIHGGLEKMICRYPIATLLISAGISFILGRRIFR
ncbi:MAG: YtxH domain-containing protein [Candidatus Viridilinea halotolerans]|uniref:YtxH domain-containing protein n=1 Tax=Candidatus Viridilinea halotolerans TaxID=2491704 RepID=A0A426U492_9CHLR|nr:MAG: YtxH domain-containing protein [Candidatus Viridilinea halotolerans]